MGTIRPFACAPGQSPGTVETEPTRVDLEGPLVSAQPHTFHGARPAPKVPNTIKGIRAALPAELRPAFQDELDEAIDTADLKAIDDVKGKWWAQATWNTDPAIREAFAAIDRGDFHVAPDPFAAR